MTRGAHSLNKLFLVFTGSEVSVFPRYLNNLIGSGEDTLRTAKVLGIHMYGHRSLIFDLDPSRTFRRVSIAAHVPYPMMDIQFYSAFRSASGWSAQTISRPSGVGEFGWHSGCFQPNRVSES